MTTKMTTFNFYDTSSLLLRANNLFEDDNENIVISSITLKELENIKTSGNKDADVKYSARKLLHVLDENKNKYDCIIFKEDMMQPIIEHNLPINDDMRILACAIYYDHIYHPDETVFITNDLSLKCIANLFFGEDSIFSISEEQDDEYLGFIEVSMTEQEMADFYSNPNENTYNLLINQYLLIKDQDNKIVDSFKWTGSTHQHIVYKNFCSRGFGDVKPYRNDPYQAILCDSLYSNKITMVKGPAGSGKTFLSLAFYLYLLEQGKIDKIIVFCNTVATKNSAKLGYLPGTRDEKLLDSQIGNLLSSKLGDKMMVENMINDNKLILLPFSDIRGYDTTGMSAGIYISEAQNLDISLMKLALQRIGEDSICIIDGDCKTQVDMIEFAGANNGMRRASKVFRGADIYGEVTLQQIHRSQIAQLAELM